MYITRTEIEQAVNGRPEINLKPLKDGTELFCYAIAERDTWKNPTRLECRGISFIGNDLVLLPYHKFFELGENEHTLLHVLDKLTIENIKEKLDGSLMHATYFKGKYYAHQKRSLYPYELPLDIKDMIKKEIKLSGCQFTFIFEHLYSELPSEHQSVLEYKESGLVLLDVRVNKTGEYMSTEYLKFLSKQYGVKIVEDVSEKFNYNLTQVIDACKHLENAEGFVVTFKGGLKVKVKCDWYSNAHHLLGNPHEKFIVNCVLNDQSDSLLSTYYRRFGDNDIYKKVKDVVDRAKADFNDFLKVYADMVEQYKDVPNRELVKILSNFDMYTVTRIREGKKINMIEQYRKVRWDRWSSEPLIKFNAEPLSTWADHKDDPKRTAADSYWWLGSKVLNTGAGEPKNPNDAILEKIDNRNGIKPFDNSLMSRAEDLVKGMDVNLDNPTDSETGMVAITVGQLGVENANGVTYSNNKEGKE